MHKVNVAHLIIKAFDAMFNEVFGGRASEFWMKGGRGSTKSSFISIVIVLLIVSFPFANAVVIRRFSNTLKDSVYEQIGWAINALGLGEWFKGTKSPMEYVYKPTGQRIVFRGLDDPLKLKSTKFSKGYAAIQWFEELDQINCWDDVSSALKSLKRGGSRFWTFYSYNPPKTLWSWVNRKALEMERKPGCVVDHSTYLDVIESGCAEWLGQPFIEDAEYLKETDEKQYRWEMLGEITGTGGSVFDNIRQQRFSDAEIRNFEHTRSGLDWGWFPDPWRFVRADLNLRDRRLIIFEELSANRKTPSETGPMVVDALTWADRDGERPRYHDETVWCDDTADGKVQMREYRRDFGIKARPARKGGMRKLSYQWLQGLREIVIDPVRCPLTFEEFSLKEYEKDRNDQWIDEIPDGNDHSIDAVRYMVMEDVIRGR